MNRVTLSVTGHPPHTTVHAGPHCGGSTKQFKLRPAILTREIRSRTGDWSTVDVGPMFRPMMGVPNNGLDRASDG